MKNTCEACKVEIPEQKKYCSNKCQLAAQRIRKVEEGIATVRCLKNYLLDTRGHKCEICGTEEWCGKPVPLVMDHIDGDSDHNKLKNLRLVCGNCDMQLPTYKSKNRGNGRHKRKQRYREGKSY